MQMTLARLGKQSIKSSLVNQINKLLTSFITKVATLKQLPFLSVVLPCAEQS